MAEKCKAHPDMDVVNCGGCFLRIRAERDEALSKLESVQRELDQEREGFDYDQKVFENFIRDIIPGTEGKTWEAGFNGRKFVSLIRDHIDSMNLQLRDLQERYDKYANHTRDCGVWDDPQVNRCFCGFIQKRYCVICKDAEIKDGHICGPCEEKRNPKKRLDDRCKKCGRTWDDIQASRCHGCTPGGHLS